MIVNYEILAIYMQIYSQNLAVTTNPYFMEQAAEIHVSHQIQP